MIEKERKTPDDPFQGPLASGEEIHWREILALFLPALLIRIYKGLVTPVIAEDGVEYLQQAALLGAGSFRQALGGHYPPLYPAAITAMQWLIPDPVLAAKTVSALFGAICIWPLVILGRSIFPAACVRAAAVVYILSPYLLQFSGDVLSESAFCFFVLVCLGCLWKSATTGPVIPSTIAGLCVGLACLTRPEGILLVPFGVVALWVLRAPSEGRRRRAAAILLFTGLSLAPLIPYAFVLHGETGHLQFTRKGPELVGGLVGYAAESGVPLAGFDGAEGISFFEALTVIARNPGLLAEKLGRDSLLLAFKSFPHAIHPIGFVLFLAGVLLRRPSGRREILLLGFLLWYVACIAVNYPNPRFLVAMTAPAILLCGVGIEEIRLRVQRRVPWPSSKVQWTVLGIVVAGLAARAIQPERLDKVWFMKAGLAIRADEDRPRVCSRWRRLAFYSGGEHIPPPWGSGGAPEEYGEVLRYLRQHEATHLALRRDPSKAAFIDWLEARDLRPVFTHGRVTVYHVGTPPEETPDGD